MSVEFQDFSVKVKSAIDEAAIAWLHEAAGELTSQTQRNTPVDTGDLKKDWKYVVEESKLEATVGNPQQNAIWTEFGTGEHALNDNGRKGGWYIPEEKLSAKAKAKMANNRTTIKGKVFYFTKGRKPKRSLHNAFTKLKPKLIKRANEIFKENLK